MAATRGGAAESGAVLLSEFAGCARSLGGAVLVNPWDTRRFTTLLYRLFRNAKKTNAREGAKDRKRKAPVTVEKAPRAAPQRGTRGERPLVGLLIS